MLLEGNLNGLQHLGIPVVDIESAKRWYVDILDFETIHEPKIETPEGVIRIAFLKRADIVLEFYQLVGEALEEVKQRTHGHIDHITIDVLDVHAALREVTQKGAILSPETPDGPIMIPQFWSKGVEYVFLTTNNGEKVELNQRHDLDPKRRKNNINGWSHLGIPVTDIERTEAFYHQFGFKKVMEAVIPVEDQEIKASIMSFNDLFLEFYQLLPADLEEIRNRKDGFIDHVTLDVTDINQAFDELKAAGITPLEDEPVELPFWENGVKYFFVRGPDGEKFEFNQVL
jgi:lactoylglutathione lyase